MEKKDLKVYKQASPYDSPWSVKTRILLLLWNISWALFCSWTPKPLNSWRLLWLRLFGTVIHGTPFVHQRSHIEIPWNVILHDHATLGSGAILYSLGSIEIKARSIIAQEAYLCAATHDFSDPNLSLVTASITIEEDAFIGARAFVMPGITIGKGALVGACAVVTRNIPERTVCAGNPARQIKQR